MSLSPFTRPSWTWTEIQILGSDPPQFQRLQCSPTGELLMKKELVGKSFVISQEHIYRYWSDEPTIAESKEADSLAQVQIGSRHYTAAWLLPNGQPQLPPEFANTHIAVRKVDFSWCFIPKSPNAKREPWHPEIPRPKPENKNEFKDEASQPATQETKQHKAPNRSIPRGSQAPPELQAGITEDELRKPKEPKTESHARHSNISNDSHANEARTEVSGSQASRSNNSNSGDGACTEVSRNEASRSGNFGNGACTEVSRTQASRSNDILTDLETLISNHLVCSDAQRTVLALWILHTYAYDATPVTPYLNIYSPMEESGKSACMTILRGLCADPWWAAGSSPSFFKRKLISEKTTILLDNWHTLFRASDRHQMSGFLLNGCDMVPDLCARAERAQNRSVEHCRYSPKAFAGMEALPPALARRSIPIVLQRRKPHEKVKSAMWLMFPPLTEKLIAAMKAWAKDHMDAIAEAHVRYETDTIPGLEPHQQESVKVLIALAAAMGGDWLLKAYEALREVFDDYNEGQVSPTQLLSDIRDAFARRGNQQRIFTAELLEELHNLDHRTYHEWTKKGDPINAHALSAILRKHFGIYSRSQRRGEKKLRGYQLSDFIDAWERYLPAQQPEDITTSEPVPQDSEPFEPSEPIETDPQPSSISPNKNAPCLNVSIPKSKPNPTIVRSNNKKKPKSASLLKTFFSKAAELFTNTR